MSIASELTLLGQDKTAIANAITAKGGTVNQGDGFHTFATDIGSIPSEADAISKFIAWDYTELTADYFSGVTNIPAYMFFRNTTLKTVILSNTVTEIKDQAFGQSGITNITMPSVQFVRQSVFAYANNLKSITFPPTISNMGNAVFGTAIESIVFLGATPPSITNNTFPKQATTTIYVPYGCKQTYVNSSANWAAYESQIQELPQGE